MSISFRRSFVLVLLFGVGLVAGLVVASGIPRDATIPSGKWGRVEGERVSLVGTHVEFVDGSRSVPVVTRGFAATDPDGSYRAPASLHSDTRFRMAHRSGFDFGAVGDGAGRVDFFATAQRHRIVLRSAAQQNATSSAEVFEQGVVVTPFRRGGNSGVDDAEGQSWFRFGEPIQLRSGSYRITGYARNGPAGEAWITCWGDGGESVTAIESSAVVELAGQVIASDALPSTVTVLVLPLAEAGTPPVDVLLTAGARVPVSARLSSETELGFTVSQPVGRVLIGATRVSDRIEVWDVIDLATRTECQLALPTVSADSAVALRIEDSSRSEIPQATVSYRARASGRVVEGRAVLTRTVSTATSSGVVWAHLPKLVLDVARGARPGEAELVVESDGYLSATLSPTTDAPLGRAALTVRLPGKATVSLSVLGAPSEVPLHAELTAIGAANEVPEATRIVNDEGVFESAREGDHVLSVFASSDVGSFDGAWLHSEPVSLTRGANELEVTLTPLYRLKVNLVEPADGGLVTLERVPARLDEVPSERLLESGAARVEFSHCRSGQYLLHRYRPSGRHQSTRWIEIDSDTTIEFSPDGPNALLVIPAPSGVLAAAGLLGGDIITALDGKPIRAERLRSLLLGLEEGSLELTVQRGSSTELLALDFEAFAESAPGQTELRPIHFAPSK